MEKKSMNLKKLWMVNWRENKFSAGSGPNEKKKGLLQKNKISFKLFRYPFEMNYFW